MNKHIEQISRTVREMVARNLKAAADDLQLLKRSDPVTQAGDALDAYFRNPEVGGKKLRVKLLEFEDSLFKMRQEIVAQFGDQPSLLALAQRAVDLATQQPGMADWVRLADMSRQEREQLRDERDGVVFEVNGLR